MRILFLTGQVPYPPHAGGAMRTFGLLDGLHRAGHSIDLLTFTEPERPDPGTTPLAEACEQIVTVPAPHRSIGARLRDLVFTSHADMARRFYSPEYVAALKAQLASQPYDLIHIESLEMAAYLPVLRAQHGKFKVIYDSFNAEFDLQRLIFEIDRRRPARLPAALYSLLQWRRLVTFDRHACQQGAHVIAVSDADAESFRRLASDVKVSVVPNGIYTREYEAPTGQLELGPPALLFTGTMNSRPNVGAETWL